jgi:predicted  nucleic acid-binding Zn-ribbon protein
VETAIVNVDAMNNDIKTMIELQEYWDKITASRAAIEKARGRIGALEKDFNEIKKKHDAMVRTNKELKSSLKQQELDLADMEGRIAKLEDRKRIIHTEKELKALEKEIDVIKFEIGNLEDKTLALIDDIDAKEREYKALEQTLEEKAKALDAEKPKTAVETARHEDIIKVNMDRFNLLIEKLPSTYRSKFLRLLNSRDNKGISRVEGEICGLCNFKIPAFLAIEASKDDKVVNCTNCGKFIYR